MPVFLCTFCAQCLCQASGAAPWWTNVSSSDHKIWTSHNKHFILSFVSRGGPWSLRHHRDRWIVSPHEDCLTCISMVHIIAAQCKCFLNHVGSSDSWQRSKHVLSPSCLSTSWCAEKLESWTVAPHLLSSINKIQNLSNYYLMYLLYV